MIPLYGCGSVRFMPWTAYVLSLLCAVPSGNTMQVFAGHTGPVQCGEFTPDGKVLWSCTLT